jgi:tetratricopeptide (TPR) repeat protein
MPDLKEWDAFNEEILSLHGQGHDGQTPEIIQRLVQLAEQILAPPQSEIIEAVNERATLYSSLGLYDLAEPLFRRTLAVQEKVFGPDHLEVAKCLNNLAWMYHDQKLYAQAEPYYQRVLAIQERNLGLNHYGLARSLNNLADLYQAQWLSDQARPLYFRLIKLCCDINAENSEGVAALRELIWHLIMEKLERLEPGAGKSVTTALSVSRG